MLFLLFVTGLGVGLLSVLFGVGGGIIAIPALYTLFPTLPPQTVIGVSLGMVFFNSLINTFNFAQLGRKPLIHLSLILVPGMGFGVLLGSHLTFILPPQHVKLFFAFCLLIIAIKTLINSSKNDPRPAWNPEITTSLFFKFILISFFGGTIAGLTGLGGGAILVPLFISLIHMPLNWVPVYSNLAMGVGALVGLWRFAFAIPQEAIFQNTWAAPYQIGYINFALLAILVLGSFFTSRLGAKLGANLPSKWSRPLFSILLIVISAKIFYQLYGS